MNNYYSIENHIPILGIEIYLLYEVFKESEYFKKEADDYIKTNNKCAEIFWKCVDKYLNYHAEFRSNKKKCEKSTTAKTNDTLLRKKRKNKIFLVSKY